MISLSLPPESPEEKALAQRAFKVAQYKQARNLARVLGFSDDVHHWTVKLRELGVED